MLGSKNRVAPPRTGKKMRHVEILQDVFSGLERPVKLICLYTAAPLRRVTLRTKMIRTLPSRQVITKNLGSSSVRAGISTGSTSRSSFHTLPTESLLLPATSQP